jgi:hypothetical protein
MYAVNSSGKLKDSQKKENILEMSQGRDMDMAMDTDTGMFRETGINKERNNQILEAFGQNYHSVYNIPRKDFICFRRCKKTTRNTEDSSSNFIKKGLLLKKLMFNLSILFISMIVKISILTIGKS